MALRLPSLLLASLLAASVLTFASVEAAEALGPNRALGASYTSTMSASTSYPDTGGGELTDGIRATGGYTDPAWQGRQSVGSYQQLVDLGVNRTLSRIDADFLQQTGVGIYWPDDVSFAYSLNGSTFTSLGSATPETAVGSTKLYAIEPGSPITARYVRMTITDPGGWVFADELRAFDADPDPVISGSIIQPVYGHSFTEADWEDVFNGMTDVGQDHVILQWTMQNDSASKEVYYLSSIYNASAGYYVPNGHDTLDDMLTAADATGIDVWVGITWSDDWWTKASTDFVWLADQASFAIDVIDDIWTSSNDYDAHPSFAGWYVPWEIDNVNYTTSTQQLHLRDGLKAIVDHAKSTTSKPVMISPFFNDSMGQTTSQWTAMWQYLLDDTTGADFDIVALQDGIGVNHASVATIDDWLLATKDATDTNSGCQLWANIETFEDVGSDTYRPASITRVMSQIDAEAPYVVKLTSYSFDQFQSAQVVGPEQLDDWKRLVYPRIGKSYSGPTNGVANFALGKSYTVSDAARPAYPDSGGELTDGVFASGLWQGEPSFQGRKNLSSYSITIDLGSSRSVNSMYASALKSASSNVLFPASVQFLTSPDNVTFTSRGTVNQLTDPLDSVGGQYRITLGSVVSARYVKVVVTTGTTKWTMFDEIGVIGPR